MHIARNGSALVSIVLGVVACSPTSTGSGNVSAYTLTLKVQGGGRIQVTGVPDCQTNCTAYLAAGSKITLTAAPDAGSGFTSWSGDCSGKDACTLTVDANRTVTATFSALPPPPTGKHWLTIALKGSGSVTSSPAGIDCGTRCLASYDEGTVVTLTASPPSGSHFTGFGGACSGNSCTVTMSADASVVASFEANAAPPPPVTHALTVARSGDGSGSVTSAPVGIDCGGTCNGTFADGMVVTLTASAASGSTFQSWSGACSGTNASCTVRMGADTQATAAFQLVPPPDECAGFAPPPLPQPVAVSVQSNQIFGCGAGNSDGAGDVAVTLPGDPATGAPGAIVIFSASGSRKGLAQLRGWLWNLLEQIDGFQGTQVEAFGRLHEVFTVRPDGTYTPIDGEGVASLDPLGGMMVFVNPYSGASPPGQMSLDSRDAHGNLRWHAALDRLGLRGVWVDRTGNTLLTVGGKGQWVDHDGHFAALFDLPAFANPSDALSLSPRVGSGLFAQKRTSDGSSFDWIGQIDSGATTMTPPPDWLPAHKGTKIHMAFGGRAYAFIDLPKRSTACTQQIEVVAPSGKSCGKVSFPIQDGTCDTGDLSVGYDGTVVQQLPSSKPDADGRLQCNWRFWPAVFH